jgi:hypothetical protein
MRIAITVAALAVVFGASIASAQPSPFATAACDVSGNITVGFVKLPQPVLADGRRLPAGTYQLRVTTEPVEPGVGQSPNECWVEFRKSGAVAARELATVLDQSDIGKVAKSPPPRPNEVRVDRLKGGDYIRIWFNTHGAHYLVNLPIAR